MSNIVFNTINENFPVAGQDNDTQVFRDNFNSIKTALSTARTEITDLESRTGGLAAQEELEGLIIIGSNFSNQVIYKAVIQGSWQRKKDYGSVAAPTQGFSFLQGQYHVIKFTGNCSLSFDEFLNDAGPVNGQGVGKITLEIYGDGTKRKLSVSVSGSTVKKKKGFPALTLSGSHDLEVESETDPVIIEVWQHNANVIFLNYLGQFS